MAESAAVVSRIPPVAAQPRPSLLRMLGNETAKSLLVLWANRATLVPELGVLVVFFVFVQLFVGGGRLVEALYAPTLLGFASYGFAYVVTLKMVAGTLEEMNAGTLEQVHLSPLPAWALAVGRLAAAVVEAVGLTALVSGALVLALGIHFTYRPDALVPVALTVLDVAGFGLLLGGLALRLPTIGAVLHVAQGIVLFLNGSFVPVGLFPEWLRLVARLLPTTLGVEVSRAVLLEGWPMSVAWLDGSLPWLLAHSAAMLVVGGAVYQSSIERALRAGRLGPR
jgi:ABC-2 type transport system permease protein